jgi:hypothetical protein
MPPNQFAMRNLLTPINETRLANALKNTPTRKNRNTGRLKRMNANRTLVKRRAFRFSNNQTEGKLAPTAIFGTTLTNQNRNKEMSKNLTESRKGYGR